MPVLPKSSRNNRKRTSFTKKGKTNPRYLQKEWTKYSRQFREDNPICINEGCNNKSQVTDHIIAVTIGGSFWDTRNHQQMCNSCHNQKSAKEGHGNHEPSKHNDKGELIPVRGVLR